MAEALRTSDAGLKIHVVGYDVDRDAAEQLQCIAEKGGGAYFRADNTAGLSEALTAVTESISSRKALVVEAPKVLTTVASTSVQLTGPGTIRLKLSDWTSMPKYWKVTNPETGEVIEETSEDSVTVLPGSYQLVWRHLEHGSKEVTLPEVVEVLPGQVTDVAIMTGVDLVPPQGTGDPLYWQLLTNVSELDADYRERTPAAWYSLWEAVPVPDGDYTLVLRQSQHDHDEVSMGRITLTKGQLVQLPLDQGLNLQWNSTWGPVDYVKVTDQDGRESRFRAAGPVFLAPGSYRVALRLSQHKHTEADFGQIVVPESGFVDAGLVSGLQFDTKIDGEISVRATNLDTGSEATIQWAQGDAEAWPPMPLGAGRYKIDMTLKGTPPATIIPEISIAPGQFITVTM